MRHCFVFITVFSEEGGIQSYARNVLAAYLEGLEPVSSLDSSLPVAEIFLLRDSSDCQNPFNDVRLKFHYLKTLSAWRGRLKLAIALLQSFRLEKPQRVFCGHSKLSPLIALLCRLFDIPYTVMTYGKEVWEPLPILEKLALHQANSIWTLSRYSRDRLCQANQIEPERVHIVPCVVDGDVFCPGPASPVLMQQYGLAGHNVLITVARLWSGDIYKGVDVTLRALPQILYNYPQLKYLVIGRGDDQPRLVRLAEELGVTEQVIFVGFVPSENLVDYYRLADGYVMPSQEGFGIVYLEALACGVPVIAGDADGSADPLQDGQLGWQVPHRNVDAVAKACIELLNNKNYQTLKPQLREKTLKKFSKIALVQVLQSVIGN
ncbi:MAG: glycosyltransferase family 4 protein [Snowella sp.]|nr:glycosyltransferase family 4 protein [Snowella sp.]